jgi:hypothetical protein
MVSSDQIGVEAMDPECPLSASIPGLDGMVSALLSATDQASAAGSLELISRKGDRCLAMPALVSSPRWADQACDHRSGSLGC